MGSFLHSSLSLHTPVLFNKTLFVCCFFVLFCCCVGVFFSFSFWQCSLTFNKSFHRHWFQWVISLNMFSVTHLTNGNSILDSKSWKQSSGESDLQTSIKFTWQSTVNTALFRNWAAVCTRFTYTKFSFHFLTGTNIQFLSYIQYMYTTSIKYRLGQM